MLPRVDDSSWPVVTIDYCKEITFEEIAELGKALERIFRARGAMVVLADIGKMSAAATTALHRRKLAEESDRLAAMGALLAEAVVVPNPIVRSLYLAYTWAAKPKSHPSQAFPDAAAALVWARRQATSTPAA